MTKQFKPTVPRPEWTDELKEKFLIGFIKKHYPDYAKDTVTDEEWKQTSVYQSLDSHWDYGYSVPDIARDLMYDGWDYESIKALEDDKDIEWESRNYYEAIVADWIKTNNYTNPFKDGDTVRVIGTNSYYDGQIGTIVLHPSFDEDNTKHGQVTVKLPHHIEETNRMRANGGTGEVLGTVYDWENLELLDVSE